MTTKSFYFLIHHHPPSLEDNKDIVSNTVYQVTLLWSIKAIQERVKEKNNTFGGKNRQREYRILCTKKLQERNNGDGINVSPEHQQILCY